MLITAHMATAKNNIAETIEKQYLMTTPSFPKIYPSSSSCVYKNVYFSILSYFGNLYHIMGKFQFIVVKVRDFWNING